MLIGDYQDKLQEWYYGPDAEGEQMWSEAERTERTRRERSHWADLIDTVSNDRLGVRNYEIRLAILTVLINVAAIVVTAIT